MPVGVFLDTYLTTVSVVWANKGLAFSGSFLVLISLTSPVLSSVAALLTIFLVAIVDWFLTGVPLSTAAVIGGLCIIAAFCLLSWSTFREMEEERRKVYVGSLQLSEWQLLLTNRSIDWRLKQFRATAMISHIPLCLSPRESGACIARRRWAVMVHDNWTIACTFSASS